MHFATALRFTDQSACLCAVMHRLSVVMRNAFCQRLEPRRAFFNYDYFALVSLYLLIQTYFQIEGSNRNPNSTGGMFTHVSLSGLLLSIAPLISISIVYTVDFS